MHTVSHSNSYCNMKYIQRFRIIYIFKTMCLLKKELWEPHLQPCPSFASLLFLKVRDGRFIQKSLQDSQTLQAIKTDGFFGAFSFCCCCPFPWKMHRTWRQSKKDCCICVFLVWLQWPMFFIKTPLINCIIFVKGKLGALSCPLKPWCDEPRLKADKRQITRHNLPIIPSCR